MNVFVEHAEAALRLRADPGRFGFSHGHFAGGAGLVSRSTQQIEVSRLGCVHARENHVPGTETDVQTFILAQLEGLTVHRHGSRGADVDHTEFTSFEEIVHSQLFAALKGQRLLRADSAHDHPIDVAVGKVRRSRDKQVLHQKLFPHALGGVGFEILRIGRLPKFHGVLLSLKTFYSLSAAERLISYMAI